MFHEFTPVAEKRKRSKYFFIGIFGLAAIIALGSTLAANINLNGSAPVEFGQGIAQTTACDDSIILTPESAFVNSPEGGDYQFTSITVSDISNSCSGKDFIIKAYKSGGNSALPFYLTNGTDTYYEIRVSDDEGSFSLVGSGLLSDDILDITNGFKVTFVTGGPPPSVALTSAQDVDRISIESLDSIVGSLSFNNNSINYEADDAFKLGLNDFTIESWAYISSNRTNATIYDTGMQVNNEGGLAFWVEGSSLKYRINGCFCATPNGYDIEVLMSGSQPGVSDHNWFDSWHHYALTRKDGIIRMFVDGILVASSYDSIRNTTTNQNTLNLTRNAPSIGRLDGYVSDYYLEGKIDSLRVVNGAAKYTGNFIPPQQFSNEAGTVLLLDPSGPNSKFLDRSDYHWAPSINSVLPTWTVEHR